MAQEPTIALLEQPWLRYWLATRPQFLLGSLTPVLVSVASVAYRGYSIKLGLLLLTLIAAALVHAGANVLNDYYDELNGTDRINTQRLFPFTGGSRFIQNGVFSLQETFWFGLGLLGSAIALGLVLIMVSGGGLFWIGLSGLCLGWGYSAPPLRLNSRGLGEPALAVGFGSLIPLGAWFVQTSEIAFYPLLISLPLALLIMNILYINQFPDYQADKRSGKRHWVVRLGLVKAPWIYIGSVVIASLIIGLLVWYQLIPVLSLISLFPLLLAFKAGLDLLKYADKPAQLEPAIKLTIISMALHGLFLMLTLGWAAI